MALWERSNIQEEQAFLVSWLTVTCYNLESKSARVLLKLGIGDFCGANACIPYEPGVDNTVAWVLRGDSSSEFAAKREFSG